jgi:5-deoxy-glucuronate isomerase
VSIVEVTPATAGWTYSGLTVIALAPGESHSLMTGEAETLVLPLSGGCVVSVDDTTFEVTGRPSVFAAKTDFVYVTRYATDTVTSAACA